MAPEHKVYEYVYKNCRVVKAGIRHEATFKFGEYTFTERARSDVEARAKLANEVSKSKFIRNNFNQYANI